MEYRFPIHSCNSSHVLEDPLARHISFLLTYLPADQRFSHNFSTLPNLPSHTCMLRWEATFHYTTKVYRQAVSNLFAETVPWGIRGVPVLLFGYPGSIFLLPIKEFSKSVCLAATSHTFSVGGQQYTYCCLLMYGGLEVYLLMGGVSGDVHAMF